MAMLYKLPSGDWISLRDVREVRIDLMFGSLHKDLSEGTVYAVKIVTDKGCKTGGMFDTRKEAEELRDRIASYVNNEAIAASMERAKQHIEKSQ